MTDIIVNRRRAVGAMAAAAVAAVLILTAGGAWAWSSRTHAFIAERAGVRHPWYVNFPDLIRRENLPLLAPLHHHNAAPKTVVTREYVDRFRVEERDLVDPAAGGVVLRVPVPHPAGVLYRKIVDLYEAAQGKTGWEFDYYLFCIAHYIGDLSQPLHNCPYGDKAAADGRVYPEMGRWAREMHGEFDGALDPYLPLDDEGEGLFRSFLRRVVILSVDDLKEEIARVANGAIALAATCHGEGRIMTKREALHQAAASVSLLRAVLASLGRPATPLPDRPPVGLREKR
ncbi:MAG TPA: hypothetical protein PK836_03685 [Syntrophales bacterium]|nr:hypothetical protein [Syntrophales bacterium]